MGDKGQEGGESQVEIWKIKRVSPVLGLCNCSGGVIFRSNRVDFAAAYQSLGGGQRQWDLHD